MRNMIPPTSKGSRRAITGVMSQSCAGIAAGRRWCWVPQPPRWNRFTTWFPENTRRSRFRSVLNKPNSLRFECWICATLLGFRAVHFSRNPFWRRCRNACNAVSKPSSFSTAGVTRRSCCVRIANTPTPARIAASRWCCTKESDGCAATSASSLSRYPLAVPDAAQNALQKSSAWAPNRSNPS